jgi:hypothetical protein
MSPNNRNNRTSRSTTKHKSILWNRNWHTYLYRNHIAFWRHICLSEGICTFAFLKPDMIKPLTRQRTHMQYNQYNIITILKPIFIVNIVTIVSSSLSSCVIINTTPIYLLIIILSSLQINKSWLVSPTALLKDPISKRQLHQKIFQIKRDDYHHRLS